MLVFVWMCVMAQAFFPSTAQMVALSTASFEAHMRAAVESVEADATPLIGAAAHVTRYGVPLLAR